MIVSAYMDDVDHLAVKIMSDGMNFNPVVFLFLGLEVKGEITIGPQLYDLILFGFWTFKKKSLQYERILLN